MALLRRNMERIETVSSLEPCWLQITKLQYLTHNLSVPLLGRHVQRGFAVLVLTSSQFPHQLRITRGEDLLNMGDTASPCCKVELGVTPLPRAVLVPLEALLLLHGQELEASLLLYPPEALQLLQSAEPAAGLPLHPPNPTNYCSFSSMVLWISSPMQDLVPEKSKNPILPPLWQIQLWLLQNITVFGLQKYAPRFDLAPLSSPLELLRFGCLEHQTTGSSQISPWKSSAASTGTRPRREILEPRGSVLPSRLPTTSQTAKRRMNLIKMHTIFPPWSQHKTERLNIKWVGLNHKIGNERENRAHTHTHTTLVPPTSNEYEQNHSPQEAHGEKGKEKHTQELDVEPRIRWAGKPSAPRIPSFFLAKKEGRNTNQERGQERNTNTVAAVVGVLEVWTPLLLASLSFQLVPSLSLFLWPGRSSLLWLLLLLVRLIPSALPPPSRSRSLSSSETTTTTAKRNGGGGHTRLVGLFALDFFSLEGIFVRLCGPRPFALPFFFYKKDNFTVFFLYI